MHSNRILILDTSYTWDDLNDRGAQRALTSRDLDGYFSEVWSVHPFAGNPSSCCGMPRVRRLDACHVVVEGGSRIPTASSPIGIAKFLASQLLLIGWLSHTITSQGITIIRAGDPYYLGLVGLALSRAHRKPLVIRVAGNFDELRRLTGRRAMPRLFKSTTREKQVERFTLSRADWVIAPNDDNRQFAIRNGASPERSSVVRYGSLLDQSMFFPAGVPEQAVGRPSARFVLVVSRLEPVKKVDEAIRAFALSSPSFPEVEMWIAGDGSQRAALEILCADLGIEGAVRFLGPMDQAWLSGAYRSCSVFLATQAGRAMAEAALCAAPVVGYDRDWHSELITDSTLGTLVPNGDWVALGEALRQALRNPALAEERGRALARAAARLLDPRVAVADEASIYERLARRSPWRRLSWPRPRHHLRHRRDPLASSSDVASPQLRP